MAADKRPRSGDSRVILLMSADVNESLHSNHLIVKVCSALLFIESDALTLKVSPAGKSSNSDGITNDTLTDPLSFDSFCTICTAWKSNVTRLFAAKLVPVTLIVLPGGPAEGLRERRGVVCSIDGNDGAA